MAFESRLEISVSTQQAQGALRQLKGDLNTTQAAGEKTFSGLQKGAMAFGAAFAAIGAGAAFKNTISTIMDFQTEMSGLQAVARASVEDLARLEQQARLLGATTAYGANQAAQAQKFLAQGGLEVNQILGATPQVMRLAQAGMLGLGEAADLATDVMAAMSLQISDIGRIGDVLVATSQAATTDVQGLGQALAYSAGQGADFNLTLEETVAALGMISSTGAKGSRAGTGLVGVIAQLSNVSGPAKDILDEANVSLADLNVEARGLVPVLETLAAANLSAGERQKIFGLEAAGAAGALLNGLPAYKAQIEALQDVNGLSEEAAKTMTDNLGGAFKGLGSAIAEANLQLGDSGLSATLDAIVKTGTGVVQILNGMGDEWAASTEGGERFLSTAQSLVDTLEVMAVLAGARLTTALLAATGAQYQKLAATQASAVAEAAAASAVTRRTAAEALAEKRLLGRAIAEAKATQGTAAHTAALAALNVQRARSIQASASNTVAVNAEAAAMGRASIAARGLSVAGRAGAGALALIGGPLGAAVIATGAIFHFREELGLVARPAITAAGAVDELAMRVDGAADSMLKFEVAAFTAELVSLQAAAQQAEENLARLEETKRQPSSFGQGQQGDLWAGADRQSAQLESLNNQINAREEAIGKLTDRINQLKDSEDDASDSTRNLNINIAGLDEEAAKAAKTLADNFESLKRTLDPGYSSLMDFWEGIELLNKSIDTTTIEGMTEYNRLVELLTKQYADAVKAADPNIKRVKELRDAYDSAHIKAQQLTTDLAAINEAWRNDPANGDQYARMVANIRKEMRELALEADPVAQEMARAWEEASNRIDETFSDAFAGAFDSFDSFADNLLDGFKRLLAELAYQATLKPIVVGFTADMRSMMSGKSASSGGGLNGIGSLINSGKSLLGFGSTAAAPSLAMQGGLSSAALASASQVATGATYSGALGSAASGAALGNSAGLMSSITSGISAAMPWLAGGFAIDNILGLGITDGITKALSGLFGSDRKSYGQIGSQIGGDTNAGDGVYRYDRNDRSMGWAQQTALGTIGVTKKQKTDDDALIEMVAGLAQFDNTLASVMTAAQLDQTRAALDGWKSSRTENIGGLVDERLSAVLNATNSVFRDALSQFDGEALVQGLVAGLQVENVGGEMAAAVAADMNAEFREALGSGSDIQAATQSILSSAQAVQTLGGAVDRLNLQFDATAAGALDAAGNIAARVGGVAQLESLQDSFYQNFFTDAERAAHLQADLTAEFARYGAELPETREAFRELVNAQDQNTAAGQRNYAALLRVNSAFAELVPATDTAASSIENAADRVEQAGADLLAPVETAWQALNQSVDAERKILDAAHRDTTASIRSNMNTVQEAMRQTESVAQSLNNALRQTQSGTMYAREQGQATLRRMLAAGEITDQRELDNALQAVAEPSEQLFGSFLDYQRDFVGTAHDIYNLSQLTDDQLSTQEKSLRALERQLETADMQFNREIAALESTLDTQRAALEAEFGTQDWLSTVNSSVLTVAEAIANLQLSAAKAAEESGGGGGGGAGGVGASGYTSDEIFNAVTDIQSNTTGGWDAADKAVGQAAINAGVSSAELAASLGISQSDVLSRAEELGLPAFANGGAFTNGIVERPTAFPMGLMGEAGSEAIMPLTNIGGTLGVRAELPMPNMPPLPFVNQQSGSGDDMSVLVKRIEALTEHAKTQGGMQREALKALKALVRQLERWDEQDRLRVEVVKTVEPTA